jgi:hypothetical protein
VGECRNITWLNNVQIPKITKELQVEASRLEQQCFWKYISGAEDFGTMSGRNPT